MRNRRTFTPEQKAEMVLEVLAGERALMEIASENGVHPNLLSRWKVQFVENASSVFENEKKSLNAMRGKHKKQVDELKKEMGKLAAEFDWLKEKLAECISREDRLRMIEDEPGKLSLAAQCRILNLNRSGLYYKSS